jgi:hypothetical protein
VQQLNMGLLGNCRVERQGPAVKEDVVWGTQGGQRRRDGPGWRLLVWVRRVRVAVCKV